MNAKLRLTISVLLLSVTLVLGFILTQQAERTTLAGSVQPPYEFSGPIVSMPPDVLGTWLVGNTRVVVDQKTDVRAADGPAQVGAWVRVRAVQEDDVLRAQVVRVLPRRAIPAAVDVHGVVNKVKGEIWLVSGRQVRVPESARIVGDISPVGAVATIRGHMEGTTLVADVVILSSATEEANRVEFVGELEAVRGTTWIVDGVEVQAQEEVKPPPVGSLVSVRGQMVDTQRVVAERLAVEEETPTYLEGWLTDGSANTRAWRILVSDGRDPVGQEVEVYISEETPIDERAGLVQPGARVQVVGTPGDAGIDATFARVLDVPHAYITGNLVYIPQDPYAFPWTVDATQVHVSPSTVLDRPVHQFRLGDRVAVSGIRQPDGSILARMISGSKR